MFLSSDATTVNATPEPKAEQTGNEINSTAQPKNLKKKSLGNVEVTELANFGVKFQLRLEK